MNIIKLCFALTVLLLTSCNHYHQVAIDPELGNQIEYLKERDAMYLSSEDSKKKNSSDNKINSHLTKKPVHIKNINTRAIPITDQDILPIAIAELDSTGKISPIIKNNIVLYPYGYDEAKMACTKLRVCSIDLQDGEEVMDLISGDTERWTFEVSNSGSGDNMKNHIMVKPLYNNANTNLIITTNKRVYDIALVSVNNGQFTPRIGFFYPEDHIKQHKKQMSNISNKFSSNNNDTTKIDIDNVQFNYKVSGNKRLAWYPERVFDDGNKVYIQMPKKNSSYETPAFVVENNGKQELVNYRYREPFFVVDRLFDKGILLMGHQHSNAVIIARK